MTVRLPENAKELLSKSGSDDNETLADFGRLPVYDMMLLI